MSHLPEETPKKSYRTLLLAIALLVGLVATVYVLNTWIYPRTPYVVVETPPGEQQQVTLPDGSTAWLNVDSRLQYPASFDPSERKVVLDGEAFFEVASAGNAPFRIFAPQAVVTAEAGALNVQAYNDREQVGVAVVSGSASVQSGKKATALELQAGERGAIIPAKSVAAIVPGDMEVAPWRHGRLVLPEERLPVAVRGLERWYGISIDWDLAALQQCRVTLVVDTASSTAAVQQLADILGAAMQPGDGVYQVQGGQCPTAK
ncbi:MAG: FecR domain-containing protein [Bacteroidota bacterium]